MTEISCEDWLKLNNYISPKSGMKHWWTVLYNLNADNSWHGTMKHSWKFLRHDIFRSILKVIDESKKSSNQSVMNSTSMNFLFPFLVWLLVFEVWTQYCPTFCYCLLPWRCWFIYELFYDIFWFSYILTLEVYWW